MRLPRTPRQLARFLLVTTRAFASNVVNRISPRLHVALRKSTGRGEHFQGPEAAADYYLASVARYAEQLGVRDDELPAFLDGKRVVEYGPGDFPGVALLLVARGARSVTCADRFPLVRFSPENQKALGVLASRLDADSRARLESCFSGPGLAGDLVPERVGYAVDPDGLSRLDGVADLSISCAVLEHVNRLDLTLQDVARSLRPGGLACHVVDLSSHGFEWGNALDFLGVPDAAWRLLSSHNGSLTNRYRLSDHLRILQPLPLDGLELRPTGRLDPAVVAAARPHLLPRFRSRDDEDLAVTGHWLVARRR